MTIYSPARAACQQGKALVGGWKIHPGEQVRVFTFPKAGDAI